MALLPERSQPDTAGERRADAADRRLNRTIRVGAVQDFVAMIGCMRSARSVEFSVRALRYHCTCWGEASAPLLFMLHGWGDAGASFQFVVDALEGDWHVIAPDWRGFGHSDWAPHGYWYPDYLADLDSLLEQVSPDRAVPLIGHSMGGNIACLYAGIRPSRVAAVVTIDGFGLPDADPSEAPGRYQKWLRDLDGAQGWRIYDDFEALATRLQKQNPRLIDERAAFLARALGRELADGRVTLLADPAHRRVNPVLHRRGEAEACWRRVRAPVMWIEPGEVHLRDRLGLGAADVAAGKACFADFREHLIADAGHNLHHDAPEQVARLIEHFCARIDKE